jgi:hypothetical protein
MGWTKTPEPVWLNGAPVLHYENFFIDDRDHARYKGQIKKIYKL